MSALMQAIPEGFKQTEVGIIPEDWNAAPLHEVCSFGGGTTPPRSQHDRYFVGGNNNWIKTTDLNNSLLEISEEQITDLAIAETGLKKHPVGSVLVAMYGGFNQIGRTGYITQPSSINQALVAVKPKPKKLHSYYLLSELNYNVDYWKGVASSSRKDPNITSNDVKNYKIALPSVEEQTAIANALSDVDALLTELEKLIAKKQAIKTATMQQLLTGKTRLPQFATYTEGEKQGQPKDTKPCELGEIPEDWDVVSFGELFEQSISRKSLKADMTTTFISMQDVSESARLIKQTPVKISKVKSGFTYFERDDVLVAKITPCFENGKGCHTKQLDTEHGFGSTEFHVLRAKLNADSDFIYFWTTREIFRQELESEMVGSAGHRRVPFSALQNYKIPCPDSKEEQTAIATILSDMDNEIQTLEQRLTKTRQIKQGMMQQLLTGRTRLPFKKLETKQDGGS
ncbi:restriction endonuclease subunit S [Pseudoalteromonas sp. B160]|uniref:restriction endonuclease subunit S n=1 Tax=Pseudoalteromonas sp. B160 TaxID=630414 RepID=UPI00301D8275